MTTIEPLPPGPQANRLRTTLRIIRNPQQAFESWIAKYGDPFYIRTLNGHVIVTGRPDLVRQIFTADPDTFEPFAMQTMRPMFGAGSMLLLHGQPHRRERKLMTPMFHGDRMKAYGDIMQQVAIRTVEATAVQERLTGLELSTRASLEIIIRAIFGTDHQQQVEAMMATSRDLVQRSHPLLFFTRKSHFSCLGLSLWDRYRRALKQINEQLDAEIDQRLDSEGTSAREDILSLLVQSKYDDGQPMTRDHMRDELRTMLFAGHETSALALSWALYHVHRHPRILEKLHGEFAEAGTDDPVTLTQLPYLRAVVQETLRIHPLVTEVLRLLRRPLQLGPYTLPAGFGVAPSIVTVHYNHELYPHPTEFRPERFLERTFAPYEFLPFGGGARRCIGAAFATFEMAIVLGTWLSRYRFELLEPRDVVPKRRNITLGPSTNIRLRRLR